MLLYHQGIINTSYYYSILCRGGFHGIPTDSKYRINIGRSISRLISRKSYSGKTTRILSFYQYCPLTESEVISLRERLLHDLNALSIKGRIYLSCEGINGSVMLPSEEETTPMMTMTTTTTMTTSSPSLISLKNYMETSTPFKGLPFNPSWEQEIPKVAAFDKLHVRVRKQLVADERIDFQVTSKNEPEYLSPEQFHYHIQNLESSKAILLDIRNHYER
jgi:UPF0176 protein